MASHPPVAQERPGGAVALLDRYTWRMERIEAVRRLLGQRADVRLAYVFGSVARGEARASSDFDVAILFSAVPEPRELDRLGTDLEVVARRRLDLVVLNTAPPLLTHEILKTGRRLACRDEQDRVDFEARAIARYLDTEHLRETQRAYLREHIQEYRARSG